MRHDRRHQHRQDNEQYFVISNDNVVQTNIVIGLYGARIGGGRGTFFCKISQPFQFFNRNDFHRITDINNTILLNYTCAPLPPPLILLFLIPLCNSSTRACARGYKRREKPRQRLFRDSLFLKHDEWVHFNVGHFDIFTLLDDLWVFAHHQPSDVREEESPRCVVWVAVRVAVFVVLPVISNPHIQAVLRGKKQKKKTRQCYTCNRYFRRKTKTISS